MTEKVTAPFTDDQVESMNAYQESGVFHPFTCGNGGKAHPNLVAHNEGWVCAECDYTQQWTHTWMADWSWEQTFNFGQPIDVPETATELGNRSVQDHKAQQARADR